MYATPRESKVYLAPIMSGTTLRLGKLALVVFTYFVLSVVAQPTKDCDTKQCKGPLMFYKDLNCKPIYENPNDCCAIRYDCSHLYGRSTDKCYINGKVYAVGEYLKNEDRDSPCDIGCYCSNHHGNDAGFICATVDCFFAGRTNPGCYTKYSPDSCCGGEEVCPKSEEQKKVTCLVDGNTYFDGQSFYPENEPDLSCHCMEGYEGKNVEPFCKIIKCGVELRHANQIRDNCVPVYYTGQTPKSSCNAAFRCQNNADVIVPKTHAKSTATAASDDMKCKFGNLTLNIGDELNQSTDYSSVCIKCVCEVPPTLTCQQLPEEVCTPDYSKFHN